MTWTLRFFLSETVSRWARTMPSAARMIRPQRTVPLHYNTFPLIQVDTANWAARMQDAGFAARVLDPGETLTL